MISFWSQLTTPQRFGVVIGVLGYVAGAGTILTQIFSPLGAAAPIIVSEITSLSTFVTGTLGVILTATGGNTAQVQAVLSRASQPDVQTALVKAVAAMPGIESVQTNKNTTPALTALAQSDSPDAAKIIPPKG